MASVNKAIIIGNLGKDPEVRYTTSGEALCNFSIACTETWKDKATGEKKELTEWVRISFFGDLSFTVNRPQRPITLHVEKGRVADTTDSTPEFERVLADIRERDGEVWVRELGFGMNRAFTQERTVSDIGTFERMCGVHLSLGSKHATYNKPGIRKKTARHHVDVFVLTESVRLDEDVIYREGAWRV